MNAKEAVQTAKKYVVEIYDDEPAKHIGVEEVVFDQESNSWKITVGFFRPWDKKYLPRGEKLGLPDILGASAATEGEYAAWKRRSFKVIQVNDNTGIVESMTHRSLPSMN